MTLRNQKSVVWAPAGLSDALDSSEEDFPGSLALCQNLIPAQNNRKMMVARPAATILASLPDFGGGPVTCLAAVGNQIYGMYKSAAFAGQDRPFSYNLATGTFAAISGMASGNLPTSQATTGDWTPPTAENVGTRVLFTHPGFPDGPSNSAYVDSFFANTTNGQPSLNGITPAVFPFLAVGMQLFGTGIPAATTISAISQPIVYTTATGTSANNFFTVASATGIVIGQAVSAAAGIPANTTVTNVAGTTITISNNLTANLTATQVTFTGSIITMSVNATATANSVLIVAVSAMANKFGWLDISNFSLSTAANSINGIPALLGNPNITGIQPGMTISGPNLPAGTLIQSSSSVVIQASSTTTNLSPTVTIPYPFPGNGGIQAGQVVSGVGIPAGTLVSAVNFTSTLLTITLNQAATASGAVTLTYSGAIITLSQLATAGAVNQTYTIAGGTTSAPLWGAGDTNIIPLPGTPLFVRQLAGSACFGVNTTNPPTAGVTFSDPGIPCQVSQANQSITFKNAVPVTAASGLPLENQLGGIIQSLIVFQGASNIQQITGSIALANITVNASQVATGTFAPNSIASTPKGLIFASPFGLRVIDFDGRVTDPIGARGKGAVIPFQNAVNATRINASFNENTYRVTISWQPPPIMQNIWGSAVRTDEFWLHLDIGTFTGPHTSVMDLSAPWISLETFVCAPTFGRGGLYVSDPDQAQNSTYIENGAALTWTLRTTLLPDDESMLANALVESDIFASMTASTQWLASFIDDQNVTLAQAYVWLGPNITQSKLPIFWNKAIAFRQGSVLLTGNSEQQTLIGAIGMRYQKLKYQITFRPVKEFVLGQSPLGGPDVLGP